ncbi:TPA: site-specific integrase [Streptococcus equi subsp. zooepidemicus]|uniref:site-specific integrase n=1 Tax=Streptococcus equi TaxID=1336 RepID=UPI000F6BEA8D|nr:site-specific integrase [Streptococcus equi]VED85571.1 Site-specific recombinase XerD [Streptococcus equi subsp. equi]MCD3400944.1 site-specific integrase [Streptococcus equi subsp. zooepidemicus]MCD3413497.1 site-specific integrase [Streptococcus equi subsp. zooepidemicus]MCD3430973.1 site-specific integrase [Streptococcus equi subsp. zooepidemicus]QGM23529.1 tyrosine-type recombinase/integrase [Streptococcus equi subsp. zooepidemicus]
MKFVCYKHSLILGDNHLVTKQFIALKHEDGRLQFTNFHRYVKSAARIKPISDDGNKRFSYVVKFLNYVFGVEGIASLDQLTLDMVREFFMHYGLGTLPGDTQHRKKSTVEICVNAVLDFLTLYLNERKKKANLSPKDLYAITTYTNKRGRVIKRKEPNFEIYVDDSNTEQVIFRDMPNSAFEMLFAHIAKQHTDLLMVVALGAFVGLRPSEACNVRREDSPLGPGIIFHQAEGETFKVEIDLRKEIPLRSDLKPTGRIKKERLQAVPYIFLEVFVDTYNDYMAYLEGQKYEKDYGPLNLNKQGKALTYDAYYQRFRRIIREEMIPLYLKSDDAEVVFFGQLLQEHNISPHIFRHWYTTQLVLSGVSEISELMSARGDKSPESAWVYLQNKGEIAKQYGQVNDGVFDYMSWQAENLFGNE